MEIEIGVTFRESNNLYLHSVYVLKTLFVFYKYVIRTQLLL